MDFIIISFMIQNNTNQPMLTKQSITNCFLSLYNSSATPQMRRNANQQLLQFQSHPIDLLANLLSIFQQNSNDGLKLQALVYFCNVLKRNWLVRRYNKEHSEFQVLKKDIRNTILQQICNKDRRYLKTLFDMTRFITEKDYPQNFPTFTQFVHKMIEEIELNDTTVIIMKQLRQIFYDIGERKGSVSKKLFEEHFRSIMNAVGQLSVKLREAVISATNNNSLTSNLIKLSKYVDQIILYILRVAPTDIMDESFSKDVTEFLFSKLQELLSSHNTANKNMKALLQKNIKSLIFDFGLLQLSKPLLMCWILRDFFNVLVYVLQNYQLFIKNESIRYALIGLRRIVKEFSYYGEDSAFMSSIKSKTVSINCLELRRICSNYYKEMINENTVEQLLNYLLFNPFNRSSKEYSYFDLQQGSGVDRGKQKELGMQACVILLIEGLIQRFTHKTHALVTALIFNSMQSNWTNLDKISINNLLSVIAILPSTYKKNQMHRLKEIPVLQILLFIYANAFYKIKFAKIVSGWIDAFSNEQLNSLNNVLLDFIQNEGQGDVNDSALDLLMSCCQCLNKIVSQRASAIDLRALVQRVLPVSLQIFQNIDNPEVLWPMINLISNIIVKVQFDAQLIVNSVDPSRLSLLIANQSPMLVQALCQMFKSFLCVIPRNMAAKSVYELVCYFLSNHLSQFSSVNHQKIFHLWYIVIRQYSPIQSCESLYVDLFLNHFRKNLYRKTATLVYILQQYLLSGLIPNSIDDFISLAVDCYIEAEELQKEEREKLKIATLSFQITLITKFNLEQVNSDKLLRLILQDLGNEDIKLITPTIRNSILSIINRYIILHQQSFFSYLANLNISLNAFLLLYFKSMEYLTSNTATKINAIALLALINNTDSSLIIPQFHFILRLAIPEVEKYYGTLQTTGITTFIGKVDNSPSLRFASNTLSQRKEDVRKLDMFDQIDLGSVFRAQIGEFLGKSSISAHDVASAFNDQSWADRFLKLL